MASNDAQNETKIAIAAVSDAHRILSEIENGKFWKVHESMLNWFEGDMLACAMTMEVYFWTVKRDGGWMYRSGREWQELFHTTKYKVSESLSFLDKFGWFRTMVRGVPAVKHYSIDVDMFVAEWQSFIDSTSGTDNEDSQELNDDDNVKTSVCDQFTAIRQTSLPNSSKLTSRRPVDKTLLQNSENDSSSLRSESADADPRSQDNLATSTPDNPFYDSEEPPKEKTRKGGGNTSSGVAKGGSKKPAKSPLPENPPKEPVSGKEIQAMTAIIGRWCGYNKGTSKGVWASCAKVAKSISSNDGYGPAHLEKFEKYTRRYPDRYRTEMYRKPTYFRQEFLKFAKVQKKKAERSKVDMSKFLPNR
jgi:hypothetical protein